eukprot:scaffold254006_cov27-Tisochrysis_lutea.AAC.5
MPTSRDDLPEPTGPITAVRLPLGSVRLRLLTVGGRASAAAASAAASCSASARAARLRDLPDDELPPSFFFSFSSFVSGHLKAALCNSIAGAPCGAARREKYAPSIRRAAPSSMPEAFVGGRASKSTASRVLAFKNLDRRPLITFRLMTRAIMRGTTSNGKRMMLNKDSDVKAVAARDEDGHGGEEKAHHAAQQQIIANLLELRSPLLPELTKERPFPGEQLQQTDALK